MFYLTKIGDHSFQWFSVVTETISSQWIGVLASFVQVRGKNENETVTEAAREVSNSCWHENRSKHRVLD